MNVQRSCAHLSSGINLPKAQTVLFVSAAGYARSLDPCHTIYAWDNVDWEELDLRQ